jgi:hypothetical protein
LFLLENADRSINNVRIERMDVLYLRKNGYSLNLGLFSRSGDSIMEQLEDTHVQDVLIEAYLDNGFWNIVGGGLEKYSLELALKPKLILEILAMHGWMFEIRKVDYPELLS